MLITSFRIRRIEEPSNRLIAKCTITLDDMFAVCDIKILLKEENVFYMGMPSRKTASGTFKDEAYPINAETRAALERILFAATSYCLESDTLNISAKNTTQKASLLEQEFTDFEVENI